MSTQTKKENVKETTKTEFDHKNGNVAEAIGFTDEQAEALVDKMNELACEGDTQSEAIETFINTFTKKELAFVLVTSAAAERRKDHNRRMRAMLDMFMDDRS